mmetsp:Transcript_9991/g.19766  ORF Transcript_9991/g.19766 Transcript_9991/m.19766 type:complete len:300 (+) Transcript_9991:929-1828(+)
MACASRFILEDKESFDRFKLSLDQTADLLNKGESVFVHCAGGVHRTGIFVKTLLILLGRTPAESEQAMLEIRDYTLFNCGLHRLELAEELARMIAANEAPLTNSSLWDGLRMTELLNAKDNPLLWLRYSLVTPDIVQAELFATNFELSKVIHGFAVYFQLDHGKIDRKLGFSFSDARAPLSLEVDKVRTLDEASRLIESFCTSSLSSNSFKFVGKDAHLDLQFAKHFMSRVASLAHYRIVELSSLGSFLKLPAFTGIIREDLTSLIEVRRNFFDPPKEIELHRASHDECRSQGLTDQLD